MAAAAQRTSVGSWQIDKVKRVTVEREYTLIKEVSGEQDTPLFINLRHAYCDAERAARVDDVYHGSRYLI